MDKPADPSRYCRWCKHWQGTGKSYYGDCDNPATANEYSAFDATCERFERPELAGLATGAKGGNIDVQVWIGPQKGKTP